MANLAILGMPQVESQTATKPSLVTTAFEVRFLAIVSYGGIKFWGYELTKTSIAYFVTILATRRRV